jgi:VanZ family protein
MMRALWFCLGWLQALGITVLCLWPLRELPGSDIPWSDKLYHAAAFGSLMWWFAVALPRSRWWRTGLLVLGLGVAIEFLQGFVPFRAPSLADALADGLGVLVGALCAHRTPRRLQAWQAPA